MLRALAFWLAWALLGAFLATLWLEHACPPGGCSFILVLLQAPAALGGAFAWLMSGIAISFAVAGFMRSPVEGRYLDGQEIHVGDRVRFGKTRPLMGEVVHVPQLREVRQGYDPSKLPPIVRGFVVRTDDGELHHFPAGHRRVVLLARAGPA